MLQIVPLSRDHDRAVFSCGVPQLDTFFKAVARQHAEKGISRTFVLSDSQHPKAVFGFFTLSLTEVMAEDLPKNHAKGYPSHALPAVRLARLAVARPRQGKGFGKLLLAEAIHRTVRIAEQAGLVGLFVDAKDAGARSFYEHFGFVCLSDQPVRLFLPVQTLRAVGSGDPSLTYAQKD